jgi:hypothetical protein
MLLHEQDIVLVDNMACVQKHKFECNNQNKKQQSSNAVVE